MHEIYLLWEQKPKALSSICEAEAANVIKAV